MKLIKAFLLLVLVLISNEILLAQCAKEYHSTNEKDSWLSCQAAVIPNSNESANYHWLYYDLGYIYQLGTVKIQRFSE